MRMSWYDVSQMTLHNYRPQTKFGARLYFHNRVSFCSSVHEGEGGRGCWLGFSACITGHMSESRGGSASMRGGLPQKRGLQTPSSDTTGYSQQAGSTHPIGMHFCLRVVSRYIIPNNIAHRN